MTNNALQESLTAFQKACPSFTRSKEGYGYFYTPLEEILSIVQPILHKYDLCLTQYGGVGVGGGSTLVTKLIHKSGEELRGEIPLCHAKLPDDTKPQQQFFAWGSSLTYARRYSIKMILGIEPDMDTNTEEKLPEKEKEPVCPMPKRAPAEVSPRAKEAPMKGSLKQLILAKLKTKQTKEEKSKIISIAEKREQEGKLSKADLKEIKAA